LCREIPLQPKIYYYRQKSKFYQIRKSLPKDVDVAEGDVGEPRVEDLRVDVGELRRQVLHSRKHLEQEVLLELRLEGQPERHLLLVKLRELVGEAVGFLETKKLKI
jgi:hypothetical protein